MVIMNGQPLTLRHVHDGFGRWLAFPFDETTGRARYDLVDITMSVIIANRMDGDPLWLFLVAPPSGGKTEVLRATSDVPDVFPLSSLTPQTFASGFERKGVETSLLPKITGKTVVMKDFGTVLTMYREKKGEILAQLREIYDGSFTKEWGNGKSLVWNGKVGLLAGVTPIIDREYALGQILGERFLLYRIKGAPARDLAMRAIKQQSTWEQDQRRELREIVAAYVESLLPVPPPMPEPIIEAIAALAEFTAKARSPVLFDSRGEIDYIPEPEAPGRLAKQLVLLARALAVVRAERIATLETYLTVFQVAQDTLPAQRRVMLEVVLSHQSEPLTTTDVATATDYPTSTARRYLQELAAIRFVDRLPEGQGRADRWVPSEMLLGLLDAVRRPTTHPDLSSCVRESVVSE